VIAAADFGRHNRAMHLSLELPQLKLASSYIEFLRDMNPQGDPADDFYGPKKGETQELFVARMLLRETAPEAGLIPESIYWILCEGSVAGRISLRHTLNENLRLMGGHIGYEVRPSFRRRGIATQSLAMLLKTPKAREISRLLLTCSPDNVPSIKTIERNGGVFDRTVFVPSMQAEKNHYWIEL
jgi:predicted acetyltransferase